MLRGKINIREILEVKTLLTMYALVIVEKNFLKIMNALSRAHTS